MIFRRVDGLQMENVAGANLHDHLLAAEERVADELASSQRDGLLTVRHVCGIWTIDPIFCLLSKDRCRCLLGVDDFDIVVVVVLVEVRESCVCQ
jgi:hypothetical protein